MANEDTLRIVSADKFEECIIIGFSNGRGGLYSAALLYGMLPQSEELFEPDTLSDLDEPDGSVTA